MGRDLFGHVCISETIVINILNQRMQRTIFGSLVYHIIAFLENIVVILELSEGGRERCVQSCVRSYTKHPYFSGVWLGVNLRKHTKIQWNKIRLIHISKICNIHINQHLDNE